MEDRDLLSLVDLCYQAVEAPDAWQPLVRGIAAGISAEAGDLCVEDYDLGVARALGSTGFDPAYRESYDDDFLGANPWIVALKAYPTGRSIGDHGEPADFESSTYYNEWVRPQGYRFAIGAILENSPSRLIHIGFLRGQSRGRFNGGQAQAMDRLLPHVHRAVTLGERLRASEAREESIHTLVDALHLPAFLLGGNRKVVHANRRAEALCIEGSTLSIRAGRLWVSDPKTAEALDAAASAACHLERQLQSGLRPTVFLRRPGDDKAPLVLEVVPLRNGTWPGGASCLVLVNDPSEPLPERADLLRRLWGLTPSEARLAWALANGDTVAGYAENHAIAASTARWHLKNVQAKTDARTAESLVALIRAVLLPI